VTNTARDIYFCLEYFCLECVCLERLSPGVFIAVSVRTLGSIYYYYYYYYYYYFFFFYFLYFRGWGFTIAFTLSMYSGYMVSAPPRVA